jgi:ATP-dependent DNA helicase RecG
MPKDTVVAALSAGGRAAGRALLDLPEDQWYERKGIRDRADAIADTLIAFANAEGGVLVVGLHGGTVEGVDAAPRRVNEIRQAAIDFTVPPLTAVVSEVPCRRADGSPDHLLAIDVPPSSQLHVNRRDECLLRIGDEDRRLGFHQRQELLYDKGQAHFDATLIKRRGIELDQRLVADLARRIGHPEPARVLNARNLVGPRGELTAAAVLLFGLEPQRHYPEAYVRVLRYRGRERGTGVRQQLLNDVACEGPIPTLIKSAAKQVRLLQPARRALGPNGRFRREALIPEAAWLEGLVNAVVHRSYSIAGDHIRIEIFDDRIEIESPGRFPGLVDVEDPRRVARFARNPRIARVCKDLDFGQELGEGIRRIFDEMRAAGLLEPLYRQTSASVRLALSATPGDAEQLQQMPSRSREAFELIRTVGAASTGDVADALALTKPATLKRLYALREAGLIEWVGSSAKDPRAYWRLPSE